MRYNDIVQIKPQHGPYGGMFGRVVWAKDGPGDESNAALADFYVEFILPESPVIHREGFSFADVGVNIAVVGRAHWPQSEGGVQC